MSKENFSFYRDWRDAIYKMPSELQVEVFHAVCDYALDGNINKLSNMGEIAMAFIRPLIDRNNARYEEIIQKRSGSGKLGGRRAKKQMLSEEPNALNEEQKKQMLSEEPNALNEEQKKQMLHNIYNNKDNNKYNNKYNKYPKGYEGIDFSFLSSDFTEVFLEWLCYKQERKECYKSERALRACYNKLVKISGGSPAMAEKIISESMANNWKGFFELDKQKNGDNKQTGAERQYQAGATAYERVVARITERQNKPPKETDGELFSD